MQGNPKQQQKTQNKQKPKIRFVSCGKIGQKGALTIEQMKQRQLRQTKNILKSSHQDYGMNMNQFFKSKTNDASNIYKQSVHTKQHKQTKQGHNNVFKEQSKTNQSLRINNHMSTPPQDSPTKQKNQPTKLQKNQENNLFVNLENKQVEQMVLLIKEGFIKEFLSTLKNYIKNPYLIGEIQNSYNAINEYYKYWDELSKEFLLQRKDQLFQSYNPKYNIFQEMKDIIYSIFSRINKQLQIYTNIKGQNDHKKSSQNIKRSFKQIVEKIKQEKQKQEKLKMKMKSYYENKLRQKQTQLNQKQLNIKELTQQNQGILQKYLAQKRSFQQEIKKEKQNIVLSYQTELNKLKLLNKSKQTQLQKLKQDIKQLNSSINKKHQHQITQAVNKKQYKQKIQSLRGLNKQYTQKIQSLKAQNKKFNSIVEKLKRQLQQEQQSTQIKLKQLQISKNKQLTQLKQAYQKQIQAYQKQIQAYLQEREQEDEESEQSKDELMENKSTISMTKSGLKHQKLQNTKKNKITTKTNKIKMDSKNKSNSTNISTFKKAKNLNTKIKETKQITKTKKQTKKKDNSNSKLQNNHQEQISRLYLENQQLQAQVENLRQELYLLQICRYFQSSDILSYGQFQLKNNLVQMFGSVLDYQILQFKLLYKYDEKLQTDFHKYIDKRSNLLLILQLQNGVIIGGYSHQEIQPKKPSKQGFIFSLTMNKQYHLKKDNQSYCASYDPSFITFGNNQIRVRLAQNVVYSNFGISTGYFDAKNHTVSEFLYGKASSKQSSKLERNIKIKGYEFYEVLFSNQQN